MSREVNLRYDGDVAFGGVGHQLPELLLRVESSVVFAVSPPDAVLRPVPGQVGEVQAPRSYLGQLGITFDFQPPTRAVGQVHVQIIELQLAHDVEQAAYLLRREEVAGDIEMQPSPRVAGKVRRSRSALASGAFSVEEPRLIRRCHFAVRGNGVGPRNRGKRARPDRLRRGDNCLRRPGEGKYGN